MGTLLEVRNLKKYFETSRGMLHAVDGVNLKIDAGKTFGVVGESGCGKSTLGRTIIQLQPSTEGQILFEGRDITNAKRGALRKVREDMQIIFQDPFSSLNPRMTVRETIMEPMKLQKKYSRAELNERVDALMEMVGIDNRIRNAYPHELDGGRRQRVGIARALALDPKFIVCDEPVSALDVSIQAQVLNLLRDLQEKKRLTYMFVTHDLSVVRYISDHICVMYLGQVVETSRSKELFVDTLHPYTKALLSAVPSIDILHPHKRILLQGELTSPINPKPGCRFAARCPYASEECREPQKLEEVLPEHFVACCRVKEINK